ncbi:MAG: sensor histidine kinase [Solirubrobacterales bacterium]
MTRLDLRDRVTLAATSAMALVLAVVSIFGNLLLTQRFRADVDNSLRTRAAAQQVTLESVGGKLLVRDAPSDVALDEQSWVFSGGRAIERPRATAPLQAAAQSLSTATAPRFLSLGERFRLFATPALDAQDRARGTIVVGVSLQPYEHSERIARVATLVLDLIALLAGALIIRWAVGRALRPVGEMTERAADWSEHDLHRRFGYGAPHDEISALAATLDNLLGRIDAAMRREQRLTAEIAHELRTPLSGIRAEAELALRDAPGREAEDALRAIVDGTDRMNSAIEVLLAAHIADAAGDRWCDARQTCEEVAAGAQAAADAQGVSLSVDGDGGRSRVGADSQVLAQTLSPLVENAIRHAQRHADLNVRSDNGHVVIAVTDDGEGFAGDPSEIFAPGVSSDGGAGLGLPLARRLASSFGAELSAVPSAAGGRFELRIPAD